MVAARDEVNQTLQHDESKKNVTVTEIVLLVYAGS